MDFRATKTHQERQDDESERLVRPAPKLKPPRHDKRRERVDPDSDADTDEKDPDESLNYKDIGGSSSRVVRRFLAKAERIKVRKRDTGRAVMVTEKALKEKPGEYEAIKEEETSKKEEPGEEEAPISEVRQKQPESEGEKDLGSLSADLQSALKANKGLQKELKKFGPGKFYDGFLQHNPDFEISKFPWSKDLPEALQNYTIGDLAKVLKTKPGKARQPKKAPEKAPEQAQEVPEKAPEPEDVTEDAKLIEDKPKPPPRKQAPAEPVDVTEDAKLIGDKPKKPGKAKKPAKSKQPDLAAAHERARAKHVQKLRGDIPQPARRPVSPAEQHRATLRLLNSLPDDVGEKLLNARLHPDDVDELITTYQAIASKPPANMGDFTAKVSAFYQEDPDLVAPPKTGKDYSGRERPFSELSPEDQAEAYRKHQLRTTAISLAAKQSVEDHLEKNARGMDEQTRKRVAKIMLQPPSEKRSSFAEKVAEKTFDSTLEGSTSYYSPKDVSRTLQALEGNPDAQRIAVAHFQANDYLLGKDVFINRGIGLAGQAKKAFKSLWKGLFGEEEASSEGEWGTLQQMSEYDSPGRIAKGMAQAQKFFEGSSRRYPEDLRSDRAAELFRDRVLSRIESLAPDKYVATKLHLEEQESDAYEKASAKYKAEKASWDQLREKAVQEAQAKGGPYRGRSDDESLPIPPPPQPPKKPRHYDRTRAPETLGELQKKVLEETFAQFGSKAASRVALRHRLISTYPSDSLMASVSEKAAVYRGVAPYPDTQNYQDWKQPHQRDFGESDLELILGSAKDWLATPVLAGKLAGVPRDVQLRAALDLAIYDGPYNGAITARTYNNLLARLAGVSEEETLLTVQASKGANMKASAEIRKLAAKYAAHNAPMAYDLMELATRVAQDEQDEDEDKQGQDQEQKKEAATEKYVALRSAVIKAAQSNPQVRPAFMPVLKAIKSLEG